jgi:hypothetical protein
MGLMAHSIRFLNRVLISGVIRKMRAIRDMIISIIIVGECANVSLSSSCGGWSLSWTPGSCMSGDEKAGNRVRT